MLACALTLKCPVKHGVEILCHRSEALRLFPPLLVAGPRQIPYDENGRYIAGR